MSIQLSLNQSVNVEDLPFELVERKGIGHPDTLCDAIAESASKHYSRYCLDNFGRVAHHWFDKVMLIGGEANIGFGVGKIIKPYTVIFAGKGAKQYGDQPIPLHDIFLKACTEVLNASLTGFDAKNHLIIEDRIIDYHGAGRANSRYRPMTIDDLVDLNDKNRVSNDCNLLSSYAPLSKLEKLVLYGEQYINGSVFKRNHPDTGWDVKIFGSRSHENYKLTINLPFLSEHILSEEHYYQRKNIVFNDIHLYLSELLNIKVDITINPQDRNNKIYLTVLGSVADTGDIGVVGRGNRINGLITPMRSMSIEAAAGKNPVDHTGKIYGILARELVDKIYEQIKTPLELHIFTSKEAPLNAPDEVMVRIQADSINEELRNKIIQTIQNSLDTTEEVTRNLVFKDLVLY